jgi:GT2 family glycosyltransferase
MKLSIVIICWNDWDVISTCLQSIFDGTHSISFEVIVSDNGSTDGSPERIRRTFPTVRVIENGANLGFAKGNNVGIKACTGEYILILNPDTIVHNQILDRWIAFADSRPAAGAFGCRVLNPDGSYQISARPFPTVWRDSIAALYLRGLARISDAFISDKYIGWHGEGEREIDWQSGCCVMFRGALLKELGGFDEQFFYHFEEVDLCRRLWTAGYRILYTSQVSITHLGGQSVSRFPVRFALERERNRYRYFYKHFGVKGVRGCRYTALAWYYLRQIGFGVLNLMHPTASRANRLAMYRVVVNWTLHLDPLRFLERGDEPATLS